MNNTAIKHNIQIITAFKALPKLPATFLFILPPCFIYTSASWIDHSPLVPSAFPPLCLCSGGFPHQEDSPYFLNWSRSSSNAILSKKSSLIFPTRNIPFLLYTPKHIVNFTADTSFYTVLCTFFYSFQHPNNTLLIISPSSFSNEYIYLNH